MKRILLLLLFLLLIGASVGGIMPFVLAGAEEPLCLVDIGNPLSESGHNLVSWGPIEPATHGGSWGGFNTTDENCRVIWHPGDYDPSATLTLDRCIQPGPAEAIRLRHLDGLTYCEYISDASFDLYMKDVDGHYVKLFHYTGQNTGTEDWVVTIVDITHDIDGNEVYFWRYDDIEIKLVATGYMWQGFGTDLGQVAFDWIELVDGLPEPNL